MPLKLQELIHKFEEGAGTRVLKIALAFIALVAMAVFYDVSAFRNLSSREAMDAAQLARRIAQGEGFTTDFVRPLNLYLLSRHRSNQPPTLAAAAASPVTNVPIAATFATEKIPDLSNPPFYPLLLAGVLKLMPFGYEARTERGQDRFEIYKPDLWIALFNQLLFVVATCLIFHLGRLLFDDGVAWVSAVVFVGADLFWRFSVSGLPTLLLTVLVLSLIRVLVAIDSGARQSRSHRWLLFLAVVAGLLAGLGGLTRYGFAWIIVPVVIFLAGVPAARSAGLAASAVAACLLVMTPWIVRNYQVCGVPFGTTGYDIYAGTSEFPDDELVRAIDPGLRGMRAPELMRKLIVNSRQIIEEELPTLGGSWAMLLFIPGLMLPFRNPTLRSLRGFLFSALVVFLLVQALGRASPVVPDAPLNAESLLVVLAPAIFLFGVSLFFTLLDQSRMQVPPARYGAIVVFCLVLSAPLFCTFLSPPRSALVYPPYYPPWIQEKAARLERNEAIMSDFPWAIAWYGERPSVWLSHLYQEAETKTRRNDFAAVAGVVPIKALYLSTQTLKKIDTEALQQWRMSEADLEMFLVLRERLVESWRAKTDSPERDFQLLGALRRGLFENWQTATKGELSWDSFVVGTLVKKEVPSSFPLRQAHEGLLPEIFLTESERKGEKAIQSE